MTKLLYKISTRAFLVTAVLAALVPFLNLRVLRMAGDEKVYLTQSVEMERAGRWFVQTLADEPSYFKGPLHYLLTHLGMLVFGNQLLAGTWMNCLLALLAGLAMHRLGRFRWNDKNGMLLGFATALNVGMFSHALVSQMEVELTAFYAFAVAALGLSRGKDDFKHDVLFWCAAGMAGWIKSPLHSVLLGCGGLLYWALTRQLLARLRSPKAWSAVALGVGVGLVGYLPAFVADRANFMATFLGREQFEKANNHRTWDYVMRPLLYYALPWTFVVIAAIIRACRPWRSKLRTADFAMLKLGFAIAVPTQLFWCLWTYKGQNYNIPTLPAVMLFGFACFNGVVPRWTLRAAGALGLVTLLAGIGLVTHFWPLPEWWATGWLVVTFVAMLGFAAIFLLRDDAREIAVGTVLFFVAFGAIISPLGEREMRDMRVYLTDHPDLTYHYCNLDPSIWNEWALLQLTLHHEIFGLHREQQLAEATKPGHVIIVQGSDWLDRIMKYWKEKNSGRTAPVVTPWTRWLTKGKSPDGSSRWHNAWEARDLGQLEREFFIIRFN